MACLHLLGHCLLSLSPGMFFPVKTVTYLREGIPLILFLQATVQHMPGTAHAPKLCNTGYSLKIIKILSFSEKRGSSALACFT